MAYVSTGHYISTDEEIFVNFGTSISPCIIRPVDEDGDYTYMILPIRLKE